MKKQFNLSGKLAVVTGGGSGIGQAIAKSLAAQGAYTVIFELSATAGQRVVGEIQSAGGKAEAIVTDVSDPRSVETAFESLEKSIDILVNNAGISHIGSVETTTTDDFEKVLSVNVKGVFHGMKYGVEWMKDKGGVIINMSSVAAQVGISDRFAYSMSKGAVHAMTLSVAKDYLQYNIRCNSVAPARVHTPFVDGFITKNYPGKEKEMFDALSKSQPIGRMGHPDEIGHLVSYLCSDEAAFITGSCFNIDGGFITLNS